jgi:uncharacterized membrane protein YqiK
MVDVGPSVVSCVLHRPKTGIDLTGDQYKHGRTGLTALAAACGASRSPGKYAFNTYAGKVTMVPTTELHSEVEPVGNRLASLRREPVEVLLITKDAFEPSLPLSVVVHIDYRKAPLVVQRLR